jgi:hypothetical protein
MLSTSPTSRRLEVDQFGMQWWKETRWAMGGPRRHLQLLFFPILPSDQGGGLRNLI